MGLLLCSSVLQSLDLPCVKPYKKIMTDECSARHVCTLMSQLPVSWLPRLTGNDNDTRLSWQGHITWESWVWTMGRIGGVSPIVLYFSGCLWLIWLQQWFIGCYQVQGQGLCCISLLQISGNLTTTHEQSLNHKFAILLLWLGEFGIDS